MTTPASIWREDIFSKPRVKTTQVLKALANARRLDVLLFLSSNRSSSVIYFAEQFSITEAAMSKHMRTLLRANLVTRRQMGMFAMFSISKDLPRLAKLAIDNHLTERLSK
jgi:DNA-binding transcriptional ArsR family regulator